MEIVIKLSELCNKVDVFTIEGLGADINDFGKMILLGDSELYYCSPSYFKANIPDGKVMDEYCLDVNDWYTICNKLEDKVKFSGCSECE
jgi:hypothetical protein